MHHRFALCMHLLSLQTFVLFDCKCPAKWTSQDIPAFKGHSFAFHSKPVPAEFIDIVGYQIQRNVKEDKVARSSFLRDLMDN